MSEIQNNNKIATVGYLSKVLTPIVTLVKNVKTEVMNVFSLPRGGVAGQVLAKTSSVDGEAEWVDLSTNGTLDEIPTQDSDNAVKSGGVYAALLNKQDELVGTAGQVVGFDADGHAIAQDAAAAVLPVGVEGQYIGYDADGNPVAADMPADHLTREVVDVLPDPADAVETVIYVLKNTDPDTAAVTYEEYQLVEGALVRMSGEPIDLSNYQEKLVGTETQYVGFDADGNAVAVDLPEGHLTREVIDTLLGADVANEHVDYILKVVDADDPTIVTYQHWALIDGEMVMIGGEKTELPTDHLAYEVVDVLPDVADAVEGKLYVLRVVDAVAGTTTYQEYKLLDGALVMSSADLSNVQTKLTGLENQYVGFDVDGNAVAIDLPADHLIYEIVDVLPDVADAVEGKLYVLRVVDAVSGETSFQEYKLLDGELVLTSADLSNVQTKLVGTEQQYVGFDVDGNAVAIDLPTGHLVREVVDALPLVDDASEEVIYILKVVDPDDASVTYEQWQLIDGAFAQVGGAPVELPENHLTREIVDALPAVDAASETVIYMLKKADPDTGDIVGYEEWVLVNGEFINTYVELPTNHLTREIVDVLPAVDAASETVVYMLKKTDPDTGDVIGYEEWVLVNGEFVNTYAAIELPVNHLVREVVDVLPDPADALETVLYVLKVEDLDAGTVSYSEWQLIDGAMVQVSSVDLSGYQTKLTGNAGQMIVIDADGNAVAQDFPEGMLTREVVDVLPDVADAQENVTYILKNDDGAGTITYSEWQLIDGELVQVGGEVTDMSAYQMKLTGLENQYVGFDVDGKAVALDLPTNHLTREVVDALPAEADASETVIYVLKMTDPDTGDVTGYQEWVLVDGVFVQTSGAAVDLTGYQEKLVGLEGQHVVFDADGKAVAADMPTGHLTREVVDALPAETDASEEVIYILKTEDIDAGVITYEEYIFVDGAFVKTSNEATDLSGKQDLLVGLENQYVGFDADGKAIAIDLPVGHLTREVVDVLPAVDVASESVVYILKTVDAVDGTVTYEEYILVDGAFVKTSNEATDLTDYQKKIIGTEGQHVVFDAAGELVAADMPVGHLKREVVDALPGVDMATEDVIYILKVTDPDTAAVTYEEWVLIDGAFVQTAGAPADLSSKQDLLVGTETQFVGFDVDGKAVAKEISEIVDEAKAYTDEQINLAAHLRREIVTVDPATLADTNEHTIYMFKVDGADGADVYQEWMLIDGVMTLIGDTSTTIDLDGKQDLLVGGEGQYVGFDVDGKAVALDMPVGHMTREIVDILPLAADAKEDVIYLLKVDDGLGNISYEHYQLIDGEVKAIGAQVDLSGYQEKLVGTEGQLVSFDADGKAVAIDAPTDHLVMEVVETLPAVDVAEAHKMYVLKTTDPDTAEVSYEQYQLIDGALVLVGHEMPDMELYQEKLVGNPGQLVGFDPDGNVVAMDVAGAVMDDVPTENSVNAVTSGGLYTAFAEKQDLLVGTEGQLVSFDENGEAVAIDAPAGCYTTLDELGLTGDATIEDVRVALKIGESCLIRTDSFSDLTQFNGIQYGYLKITKTVNGMCDIWLNNVVSAEHLFYGKQASGKFEKWVKVATENKKPFYTSLSQIGLTADATIDDVLAAMSAGEGLFMDTGYFTNWKTMFPYREAMDQYAYVLIIKSYNNVRNMVRWTRKDGYAESIGSFDNTNKLVGWQNIHRYSYDGNMNDGTICLTGSPDSRMSNGEPLSAYGLSNDVMTWPNGTYRFSHFTDLTNTPDNMQNGRLEHFNIKRWGGDANPAFVTWAERMSIFYASGGNVYTRYIASGATAGVYTIDTGWRALGFQSCYTSIADLNKAKGTSIELVNGEDNMQKIMDALSAGESFAALYHNESGRERFGIASTVGSKINRLHVEKFLDANGTSTYCVATAFMNTGVVLSRTNYGGTLGNWVAASSTDTKNTAGSTNSSSKLFLVGATTQAANPQTYSHDTAYVGTDGHLYSDSKQVVNLSGTQALTNKTYNGYKLGAACAKGVATTVASGNTDLVTSGAVYSAIGAVPKFKLSGTTLTITTT